MKLAIMQPYFVPYLGYFALIKHTDQWVVFDTPQFIRHGWIERNRILKPTEGWQYIKIPLIKFRRETPINKVRINRNEDYKRRILAQIKHYEKRAPYYNETIDLIRNLLSFNTDSLVELNIKALEYICEYLDIPLYYTKFSDFNEEIPPINNPDEWALEISKFLKAKEYYNLPGGEKFFDKSKFVEAGIKLKFFTISESLYDQKRNHFEPNLSIIDVIMFNSVNDIQFMLNNIMIN